MSTGMPELVAIDADEKYFDTLDAVEGRHAMDLAARVAVEINARHTAYAKVWQAGREPLAALLDACRERLTRCAEHHGLVPAAARDLRLLVLHIDETLADLQPESFPPPTKER